MNALHRSSQNVRFRLDLSPVCSVGPGKIELLEQIQRSGSLRRAASELDMSYRRAWLLLDSLNQSFQEPVSRASTGGRGGGGVELTPFGLELVRRYRSLSRRFEGLVDREFSAILPLARRSPPRRGAVQRNRLAR